MGELLTFNRRPPRKKSKLEAGQTALIVIFPGVRMIRLEEAETDMISSKPKRKRSGSPRRKAKTSCLQPKAAEF